MNRGIALLALVVFLAAATAWADIPQTLSYQGVLKHSSGQIVADGDYGLTLRLYTTPAGPGSIWAETDTVSVSGGVFSVILGKKVALTLPFDVTYWLGVSVGADAELTPRVELTSAPYAFRSAVADSLLGGAGDGDWVISGNNLYSAKSGNVGIGTVSPLGKLDVETGNQIAGDFSNSGGTGYFAIRGYNSVGTAGAFWVTTTPAGYPSTPTAVYGVGGPSGIGGFFTNSGSSAALMGQSQGTGHAIYGWAFGTGYSGYFTGGQGVRVVGLLNPDSFRMTTGASNGYVLTSDASGNGTWQVAAGNIGGSGTANYLAKFTGASTLANSVISESAGNVTVATAPVPPGPEKKPGDDSEDSRITRKFYVTGTNQQVIYGYLSESDATEDARAAVYGYRTRTVQNDGAGYGPAQTNNGVTGINYWGDVYTFGVAGYSYNDLTRTGGVIGSNYGASYWGALGYKDESSNTWGVYTPSTSYLGGNVTVNGVLRMSKDFGGGLSNVAIKAENTNTSGVALWAVTHGTDGSIVVTQNGIGDIFRGFNGGGSPVMRVTQTGRVVTPVVEITGGSDLAEPFPMAEGREVPVGALVVIDDQNPGHLKLSDRAYDHRVAGVVSGAGGVNPGLTLRQENLLEGGTNVALNGRVYALADASNGPIVPGDLLTTSAQPGHAMKATDPGRSHGAVIGKAMSSLEKGTGLVLVLVNLQ
jgi:hypothetical protein